VYKPSASRELRQRVQTQHEHALRRKLRGARALAARACVNARARVNIVVGYTHTEAWPSVCCVCVATERQSIQTSGSERMPPWLTHAAGCSSRPCSLFAQRVTI
jgi:hypothetical protein